MDMTIIEAMDYIEDYDFDGITLTDAGRGAARIILERRADWTDAHALMLKRICDGEHKVPLKLRKLVAHTRLGDAILLVRQLSRSHVRNQKKKARQSARKARAAA